MFNAVSATLSAEQATMQTQINESTKNIKKLEENWQDLQVEYERLEMLLETTRKQDTQETVRETLSQQIHKQEKLRVKYGEVMKRVSRVLQLFVLFHVLFGKFDAFLIFGSNLSARPPHDPSMNNSITRNKAKTCNGLNTMNLQTFLFPGKEYIGNNSGHSCQARRTVDGHLSHL